MSIYDEVKGMVEHVFSLDTPNFLKKYDAATKDNKPSVLTNAIKIDPDGLFALLRKARPILQTPVGFFVTRFDDVREVLTYNEVFTVAPYQSKMDASVGPFMLARDGTVINYNDKAIMQSVLRRDDLPKVRAEVARLTKAELAKVTDKVDVVKNLSRRIPIKITGEYFGFTGPDEESMLRWSYWTQYDMFHNLTNNTDVHIENVRAGQEMRKYLKAVLPQKRKEIEEGKAADNAFTRVLKLASTGALAFDDERIISNIMGLLVGGVETTSQAVVQILDQLIRVYPDKLKEARKLAEAGNDTAFDAYVWEALRFDPINPFVVRHVAQDYTLAAGTMRQTKIPKGAVVYASGRSAMRDELHVDAPESFRTDRPAHQYMHFGFGAHECLGKYVAMVETAEIVKQVILKGDLHIVERINSHGGPFPESFVVGFGK